MNEIKHNVGIMVSKIVIFEQNAFNIPLSCRVLNGVVLVFTCVPRHGNESRRYQQKYRVPDLVESGRIDERKPEEFGSSFEESRFSTDHPHEGRNAQQRA